MKSRTAVLAWICVMLFGIMASGCRMLGSHKPRGGIEMEQEQRKSSLPEKLPKMVYVADFELDTENFHGDQGVRGALPGRLQQRFEGLEPGFPTPLGTGDPDEEARKIVNEMADSITKGLTAKAITASRLAAVQDSLPPEGWLIRGVFTEVDEGNRIQRAVMGFGKGATQMEIQVGISDLQSATPRTPFAIFGTLKDPGRMPGAVVTKNPYVAAAKFVLERSATTRDVQNSAREIVDELLKFLDQVRQASLK
ncbi:MAG: DUF4410 domain-containing protein [Methylococcaceae bacterium]|nr:DUF4410 domain-containing protein [Methylococcaceae bacterium]